MLIFGFDNSKRSRLYVDYELPYLLRYGKSARTELSKNKQFHIKDIVSKVNKINKSVYSDYITNKIKK